MFNPSDIPATVYRLQLNEGFTFKHAIAVLPYLRDLGVEGIYTSPYYDAYSPHGYDITNPNALNPKIGSQADYRRFCSTIKELGLKHIIDVVPNHMGIKGGKNKWWQDVLEHGPDSEYAIFFDIDWNPEKQELKNRVLMPILGCSYGEALEKGEIKLVEEDGGYCFRYQDFPMPLDPMTYPVDGETQTIDSLDKLLEKQHYRLAYWRVASHEINYRRFFNIHELVAIRIEEPTVFEAHHKWLFELISQGHVQGLRIDHPDGLYDPAGYFIRLRERCQLYTVVEKILDREEQLPANWEVEGTVGYEYINLLNGVFVRPESEAPFTSIYDQFIGQTSDFEEILYEAKKLFTFEEMASEVEALGLKLDRLSEQDRRYRDFTRVDLTRALAEVIASFPVYRTYIAPEGGLSDRDRAYISEALAKARCHAPDLDNSIFDFLEAILFLQFEDPGYRDFVLRFQQLTGPLMAKGLEDTAFYIFNRFISLNEVGGDPLHFGYTVEEFHHFNQEKLKKWRYGFLPSSTHDTKRSEDVRMRLNVLSEIPQEWGEEVKRWAAINAPFKQGGPSPNTEYFLYQTLLGFWCADEDRNEQERRLQAVMLKSMREAKQETSWRTHDENYEKATATFIHAILDHPPFMERFLAFHTKIDRLGSLNSLSATALKVASCGVVDIYQGNESKTYRLVDPDNRCSVSFEPHPNDPKWQFHHQLLNIRYTHRALFLDGDYIPLKVEGKKKNHLIAFMRKQGEETVILLAARFFASLDGWEETCVIVPNGWRGCDLLTEKKIQTKQINNHASLLVEEILGERPATYLYGRNN